MVPRNFFLGLCFATIWPRSGLVGVQFHPKTVRDAVSIMNYVLLQQRSRKVCLLIMTLFNPLYANRITLKTGLSESFEVDGRIVKLSGQSRDILFKKRHPWRNAKQSSRPILTKLAAIFAGSWLLLTTLLKIWLMRATCPPSKIVCKALLQEKGLKVY